MIGRLSLLAQTVEYGSNVGVGCNAEHVTTAEEEGLLGAKYFARHPLVPPGKLAAGQILKDRGQSRSGR